MDERQNRIGTAQGLTEVIPNHNSMEEERINVVFVPFNYGSHWRFLQDVRTAVDCDCANGGLLSNHVFSDNMRRFNFWYETQSTNVDTRSGGEDARGYEMQGELEAVSERLALPMTVMIGMGSWPFRSNAGGAVIRRNRIEFDYARVSTAPMFDGSTVVHELGHALFGLRDEYVTDAGRDPSSIPEQYLEDILENPANCFAADSREACEASAPWNHLPGGGVGCFMGCGYYNKIQEMTLWRSVQASVMTGGSPHFGPWNEALACQVIRQATGGANGVCEIL